MRPLARLVPLLALVTLAPGLAWSRDEELLRRPRHADPVPIPGGFVPFSGAPLIHVFAPGPSPPFMGEDIEPSVIGDFDGFTAMAYLAGTATDAGGNTYDMQCDIRVYRGAYVAADGTRHHGTFGFI
ncbi:MAG TPA: hypothetical protein VGK89_07925 [Candidatus Eisenbacteria bacterium]|jgi:hypothetical protein